MNPLEESKQSIEAATATSPLAATAANAASPLAAPAATAAFPLAAPAATASPLATCPWAPKKSKKSDSHISWDVSMMTPLPRSDDEDLTFSFGDSKDSDSDEDVPLHRTRSAPLQRTRSARFPASTKTERTQFDIDDSVPTPGAALQQFDDDSVPTPGPAYDSTPSRGSALKAPSPSGFTPPLQRTMVPRRDWTKEPPSFGSVLGTPDGYRGPTPW